jgi:hypothetical protein
MNGGARSAIAGNLKLRDLLEFAQRASCFLDVGRTQNDHSFRRSGIRSKISILDVHFGARECIGNLPKYATFVGGLNAKDIVLERKRAAFAQQHQCFGRIAHNHSNYRMVHRVRNRERLNVNAGFGHSFAHARQRSGTVFEKHCKLRRRFQGENYFHLEWRMTRVAASDNADR